MSLLAHCPVDLVVGVAVGHDDRDKLTDTLCFDLDEAREALQQDLVTLAMFVIQQT